MEIDFKPTTITTMTFFDRIVFLENIFKLFPITYNPYGKMTINKKKMKSTDIDGEICSIHYLREHRGINLGTKSFKNGINITASSTERWVCVMLNKNNFKICGEKKFTNSVKTSIRIVKYINFVNEYLKKIKAAKIETRRILEEIENNYFYIRPVKCDDGKYKMIKKIDLDKFVEDFEILKLKYNEDILNFMCVYIFEDKTFDKFKIFINDLIEKDFPLFEKSDTEVLKIRDIKKILYNYNYSLGFKISRTLFSYKMMEYTDYLVKYVNQVEKMVRVRAKVKSKDMGSDVYRKKEIITTFVIYASGNVTQTSPNDKVAKKAFKKFIKRVEKIKDEVKS